MYLLDIESKYKCIIKIYMYLKHALTHAMWHIYCLSHVVLTKHYWNISQISFTIFQIHIFLWKVLTSGQWEEQLVLDGESLPSL